jgi:endonuclease/exonuclease/phosphatase family metal-dependent hydrolase
VPDPADAAGDLARTPGTSLRVGSFNLLSGRSLADGLVDPARLSKAVAALDADILAVQEVDRGQERSGGHDQAADLAAAMGAPYHRYLETVHGTPGEDGWLPADPLPNGRGPGYGIALLSRLPVAEWHVLRMAAGPGRYPIWIPSRPPRVLWLRDEPRAVVAAVLEEPRLTVACTHLSFVPFVNAWQLRRVTRWLARLPAPRLLLGDLNQPAGMARRVSGWTPLVTAPTFPSPAPKLQLDHVLGDVLGNGTFAAGRVHELPVSDHRAVVVDLSLSYERSGR